jgi:hypothetical protein
MRRRFGLVSQTYGGEPIFEDMMFGASNGKSE